MCFKINDIFSFTIRFEIFRMIHDYAMATADLVLDREVLQELYEATGGAGWSDNTGWVTDDEDMASWYGLTLDEDGLSVLEVDLSRNNLQGQTNYSYDYFVQAVRRHKLSQQRFLARFFRGRPRNLVPSTTKVESKLL